MFWTRINDLWDELETGEKWIITIIVVNAAYFVGIFLRCFWQPYTW